MKNKLLFFLIVNLIFFNFTFSQESLEDLISEGLELINNKKYEEAKNIFKLAININPSSEYLYFLLGYVYGELDQPEKEIEAYKNAIRINPDYYEALFNLGYTYKEQRKYYDALYYYNRAKEIRDNDYKLFWELGIVLFDLLQYKNSMNSYRKAIEMAPDDYELFEDYSDKKNFIKLFYPNLRIIGYTFQYSDIDKNLGELTQINLNIYNNDEIFSEYISEITFILNIKDSQNRIIYKKQHTVNINLNPGETAYTDFFDLYNSVYYIKKKKLKNGYYFDISTEIISYR